MKSKSSKSHAGLASGAALAGIGLMVLANFIFSVNSTLAKAVLTTHPVAQALVVRSIVALALLSPFLWHAGTAAFTKTSRPRLQLVRFVVSGIETSFYFLAISYLQVAEAVTFYLAAPIYVTALSPFLLGEQVGWRRWSAVSIGFVGVVIALDPSHASSMGWPSLIALSGSVLYAFFIITTRQLRGVPDVALMSSQIASALLYSAFAVFSSGWAPMSTRDAVMMSLLGVATVLGSLCLTRSLKLAPASVVVPYQYTFIVWVILLGYLVFGDVPRVTTLIGAAIIIGAGLYIFVRERQLGKRVIPVIEQP